MIPNDPKKLRAAIRRYERNLKAEQQRFGAIMDGSGKRYLLGPMYLLAGDLEGALKSFKWFDTQFSNDIGEPGQYLCWTLALYRGGDEGAARRKLRQTMLKNLYLVPHLLGMEYEELDIWHGSNFEDAEYIEYLPESLFRLWDETELDWARQVYRDDVFQKIRARYIEIHRQLKDEPVGPRRSALVTEASGMEAFDGPEEGV